MILDRIKVFFLKKCPYLPESGIKINFLGEIPLAFSINSVSVNPIVKKYPDGGSLRQYVFTITFRNFYDCEEMNGSDTMAYFDFLSEWIEQANDNNLLPELPKGLAPVSLSVVSTAYQKSHKAAKAVYEIKCKLLYERKGALSI